MSRFRIAFFHPLQSWGPGVMPRSFSLLGLVQSYPLGSMHHVTPDCLQMNIHSQVDFHTSTAAGKQCHFYAGNRLSSAESAAARIHPWYTLQTPFAEHKHKRPRTIVLYTPTSFPGLRCKAQCLQRKCWEADGISCDLRPLYGDPVYAKPLQCHFRHACIINSSFCSSPHSQRAERKSIHWSSNLRRPW